MPSAVTKGVLRHEGITGENYKGRQSIVVISIESGFVFKSSNRPGIDAGSWRRVRIPLCSRRNNKNSDYRIIWHSTSDDVRIGTGRAASICTQTPITDIGRSFIYSKRSFVHKKCN